MSRKQNHLSPCFIFSPSYSWSLKHVCSITPMAISPLFHTIFNISLTSDQITYSFVKCDCSIDFFLNSAHLICQDTNITKYLRELLGLWVNDCILML